MYPTVNVLMLGLGWAGVVDDYVCWMEGVPRKAIGRFMSALILVIIGCQGVTEAR